MGRGMGEPRHLVRWPVHRAMTSVHGHSETAEAGSSKPLDYYAHARTEIIALLPPSLHRVADVGGSSGATLSAIRAARPDVETVCIDTHLPSLQLARQRGHATVVCDLDAGTPHVIADCDAVLFLDVLEHLVDPWRVLADAVRKTRAGTTFIVSLPNVRFWEVSAGLFFRGRWELQDAGVMDRTHLRFFTRLGGAQLVHGAGLTLQRTIGKLPGARRYGLLDRVTIGTLHDFLSAQYLYVATKA